MLIRPLIAAFRNLLVARVDPALLARDLAAEDAQRAERHAMVAQAMLVRALRTFCGRACARPLGRKRAAGARDGAAALVLTSEDPTFEALSARVTALEERPAAGSAPPVPEAATAVGEPPVAAETPPAAATDRRLPQRRAGGRCARRQSRSSLQRVKAAWQSIRGKIEGERQSLQAPLSRAVIEASRATRSCSNCPTRGAPKRCGIMRR